MRMTRFFSWASAIILTLNVPHIHAQTATARAQLQRTIEDSPRAAVGLVTVDKHASGKQAVRVSVSGLGEEDFAVFVGPTTTAYSTNFFIRLVGQLSRTNIKKGKWNREMHGFGVAPLEFQVRGIADVADLGGRFIGIAKPGDDNLVQTTVITNIVGTTTNIITGSFIPVPEPNVTNTALVILWAEIPALSTTPSAASFSRKAALALPASPRPSPHAKGQVKARFNNVTGQSVLDATIFNMIRGQTYSLWIADDPVSPTAMFKAGDFVQSPNGSTGRLVRDTKFADPMPQLVGNVGRLSGRIVQVRDAFDDIHLQGVMP